MSESYGISPVTWIEGGNTFVAQDGRTYRISRDLEHDAGIGPCPTDCPGHCGDCGEVLDPDEAHPVGLDEELCADCCGCDQPETRRATP